MYISIIEEDASRRRMYVNSSSSSEPSRAQIYGSGLGAVRLFAEYEKKASDGGQIGRRESVRSPLLVVRVAMFRT